MANNLDSNFTRTLAKVFLEKCETKRVLSKNVDTQLLTGKFTPDTGDTVDFKRPTDYTTKRTANGDVSAETKNDIITGKASGVVQDYFTVFVDYDEADEAIKLDQLDQLLDPMATRIVTDLEVDYAGFMMKNSGLLAGNVGTAVTTWDHVAEGGAVLQSHGVPMDNKWCYAVNPFTQRKLASNQRSLGTAAPIVDEAHKQAILTENFAGMRVITATALSSYTLPATGDLVGAVNGAPDATYVTAKDTMTQSSTVDGFGTFTWTITAGSVVKVTGVNRLNLSTRQAILDETGANITWSGVVTADTSLTTGAGTLVVSGPAVYEATGQYNTASRAIADNDVITIQGADSTTYQPNLFWHKQAFSLGSVPIKKLHSTDTLATTADGLQFRVSKGVGFLENNNKVRIDFRPAYGVMNPFFSGQGYGT